MPDEFVIATFVDSYDSSTRAMAATFCEPIFSVITSFDAENGTATGEEVTSIIQGLVPTAKER
tara:strand:+ start:733 stop:921 length:189 start_codon:yes stop_codon:yes gene_type:complete